MTDRRSAGTANLEMTGVRITPGGRPVAAPRRPAPIQLNHVQIGRAVA